MGLSRTYVDDRVSARFKLLYLRGNLMLELLVALEGGFAVVCIVLNVLLVVLELCVH